MTTTASAPASVASTASTASARRALRPLGRLGALTTAALALGALTSWGQTVLPAPFASAANSSGGWTILAVLLVALLARGPREAALGGAAAFLALTGGYAIASNLRGFADDPTGWMLVAAVAGPLVGLATFGLRRGGRQAALGAAAVGGILIGEGVYGLTVIGATTSPVWWWVQLVLGGMLVAGTGLRGRDVSHALLAIAGTASVAALFVTAYTLGPVLR